MRASAQQFIFAPVALAALCLFAAEVGAEERPVSVKLRVTGMFSPDRADDLRQAAAKMTDIKLVDVDFANSEATFSYNSDKVLKNAKPEQVQSHIDNRVREASNHTLGVMALCTNRDKLTRIEIHIGMLDCKACGLGVYWAVTKVEGVEQATVGIKDGLVTAWINPEKTNRAAICELLKSREIVVKDP